MSRYSAEAIADVVADWHEREARHQWHPHFNVELIDLNPAVQSTYNDTLAEMMGCGVKPGKVLVCSVKTRRERWIHKSPGELRLESQLKLEASRRAKTFGDALALADQAQEKALESRGVRVLRLIAKLTNGESQEQRLIQRTASGYEHGACIGCRGLFSKGDQIWVKGSQKWHMSCLADKVTATS